MNWYGEQIKKPQWQKKRLEILSRDEWKCTLCESDDEELHVHHKKYKGKPWEAESDNLTTLCKKCHDATEIVNRISPEETTISAKYLGDKKLAFMVNTDKTTLVFRFEEDGYPYLMIAFPRDGKALNIILEFSKL